ncbi:MAG: hypothetical protein JW841_00375 [Deltaproteobacteria bacterium]|nr:hypothetical protein [Deltaproteobacteria bacterium]
MELDNKRFWDFNSHYSSAEVAILAKLFDDDSFTNHLHAKEILDEAKSFWALRHWTHNRMQKSGLSNTNIIRIQAAFEIGIRSLLPPRSKQRIMGPSDSFICVAPFFAGCNHERFISLSLDAKNHPLHAALVSLGSIDACFIDPREVFRQAIAEGASAIVLAHNHPSGDVTPSQEDIELTARLIKAGEILGVAVIDHIIIAFNALTPNPGNYVSLLANGLWPFKNQRMQQINKKRYSTKYYSGK